MRKRKRVDGHQANSMEIHPIRLTIREVVASHPDDPIKDRPPTHRRDLTDVRAEATAQVAAKKRDRCKSRLTFGTKATT